MQVLNACEHRATDLRIALGVKRSTDRSSGDVKFIIGEMQKSDAFDDRRFILLREPSKKKFELICHVLLAVLAALAIAVWMYIDVLAWPELKLWIAGQTLLVIVLLIPVHEFVHAIFYPRTETETVVIGFWRERGAFYAAYTGEVSRSRLIFVLISPFLVLSILPFIYGAFENSTSSWIGLISIANAGLSGGDIFCVYLTISQVPRHARLRNNGWDTYWRHSQ